MTVACFVSDAVTRILRAKHLPLFSFLFVLLFGVPQLSVAQCGGAHERACCVSEQISMRVGACSTAVTVPVCPPQDSQFSGGCGCPDGISSASQSCENNSGCGNEGQRACCVGEGNPCVSGLTQVAGCTGDNCYCPSGALSGGTCQQITACGGEGQRACCAGAAETAVPGELVPCQANLVQVPGCDDSTGGSCYCSDGLSKSNGTCVAPTACGGKGQRACCVGNDEFASNGDTSVSACNSG